MPGKQCDVSDVIKVNADQYHSEDVNDVSKGGLLLHALSAADKKKAPDEIIIWRPTALSDTTGNLLYTIAFPLGWLTTTCYLRRRRD
ncbi:hypothetical protein J6590_095079 [Homalodisca vitripennis]|nr:hypothetical protein J6590_095079 [Homalodisca vitripennis]